MSSLLFTPAKLTLRCQAPKRLKCMSCGSSSSSDHNQPVVLDAEDWVTLSSGERVKVKELGYRPNVAVVLFNSEGKVFTCRRICGSASGPNWQFPQGGIDDASEDPREAALRELAEETCITSAEIVAEHPEWLHYDFDAHTKERLAPRMDRFRGQKQKYFLMRFTGDDSEINLQVPGHVPEFDAYEWVDISVAPSRVAAFKRHVYENVADTFGAMIEQLTQQSGQEAKASTNGDSI